MAKDDYIPHNEGDLKTWCANMDAKIDGHAATFGFDPATVGAIKGACTGTIGDIDLTEQKKNDYSEQVATKNTNKATNVTLLRDKSQEMKEHDNYTPAIGEDLDLIGTEGAFDPATFKPDLTVENNQLGRLLKFSKSQSEGVNIYGRLKGETTWVFLGYDLHSPYLDSRPFATPAELEYKVTAFLDDAEIGMDSDIVEIISEVA